MTQNALLCYSCTQLQMDEHFKALERIKRSVVRENDMRDFNFLWNTIREMQSYYWCREHPSGQPKLGDSGNILLVGGTNLTPWNLLEMTKFWRSLSKNTIQYVMGLYTEEREEHLKRIVHPIMKMLSFAHLHISNRFIFHRTSLNEYLKMSRVLFPVMTTNLSSSKKDKNVIVHF